MEMTLIFTMFWLVCGVSMAFVLVKKKPLSMLLGAIVLTMYGGAVAIANVHDGELFNFIGMQFSGQLLLLFFSVLGGALASTALSEIRQSHNAKQRNNS